MTPPRLRLLINPCDAQGEPRPEVKTASPQPIIHLRYNGKREPDLPEDSSNNMTINKGTSEAKEGSSPSCIVKLRLDPEELRRITQTAAVVSPLAYHSALRLNPDGTPAISKDGKLKSTGWGGLRVKGQKVTAPQGRINLSKTARVTQSSLAISNVNSTDSPVPEQRVLRKQQTSPVYTSAQIDDEDLDTLDEEPVITTKATGTGSKLLKVPATSHSSSIEMPPGGRGSLKQTKLQLVESISERLSEGHQIHSRMRNRMEDSNKSLQRTSLKLDNNKTSTNLKASGSHDDPDGPPAKRRRSHHQSSGATKKAKDSTKQKGYTVKGVPATTTVESEKPHPDLARHIERGTVTEELHEYYDNMSHNVINPLAGHVHDPLFTGLFRETVPGYDLQIQYHWTAIKNNQEFDKFFNDRSDHANSRVQEENFHVRPAVRIPIPDHLKAMLVDDWENVTKNQMLVPIPCSKPVNKILDDYLTAERPKRLIPNAQGKNGASSEADILMEVVAGLREYFEKCLGRILLYKFERNQYLTVFGQMNSAEGDFAGKEIGDIYGAEHFCRLLVTLPELIAQTNMSKDAVGHLRDEIIKITDWLAKNAIEYFASAYEHPGQDYIENARHS